MNKFLTTASVAVLAANTAVAGGLDRSGQDIGVIFEDGGYVELSYGMVTPNVTGTFGGAIDSGNMAPGYSQFSIGVKHDINDRFSIGVVLDQPYGAEVSYPIASAPYPLAGTAATVNSQAVTAIGRYKFSDRVGVHAGIRTQNVSGDISITGGYLLNMESTGDFGYLVGASYEIPDIAMRVALTYNSAVDTTLTGTELGAVPLSLDVTFPQSINLDFQTGIAADTLLFGSIRWTNWTAFDLAPPIYAAANGGASLLDYDNDVFTYSIGVGRKFSESFSGSIALGYEASTASAANPSSNLSPTDGYVSLTVGGKYTKGNMDISGGIRYVKLGDATTSTIGSDFADNSAIGVGVTVGYRF